MATNHELLVLLLKSSKWVVKLAVVVQHRAHILYSAHGDHYKFQKKSLIKCMKICNGKWTSKQVTHVSEGEVKRLHKAQCN